ncbi:hypothetical protein OAE48_05205, partial [Flavobacteriales bacterium]|nr:hypothetical protein [Flavobacteriales bacterium]
MQFVTKHIIRTIALLVVVLVTSLSASAQFPLKFKEKKQLNLTKYDRQMFHFGFSLGLNYADLAVKNVENIQSLDSVFVVEPKGALGFNLGIV